MPRKQYDDIDADYALIHYIINTLDTEQYWHEKIRHIFAAAGFTTRRVEREEAHPVWQIWLTPATFNLAMANRAAINQPPRLAASHALAHKSTCLKT
jgi:hypothetical protein